MGRAAKRRKASCKREMVQAKLTAEGKLIFQDSELQERYRRLVAFLKGRVRPGQSLFLLEYGVNDRVMFTDRDSDRQVIRSALLEVQTACPGLMCVLSEDT